MLKKMLREIIDSLRKEIKKKVEIQEEISDVTREILFLSKQSIMAIHSGKMEEAKLKMRRMEKVKNRLEQIQSLQQGLSPGSIKVALQEYAEAKILAAIVEKREYPNPREIKISAIYYILGLADSIGEFRRRALNCLRDENLKEAERSLRIMEEIYEELISLEKAYVLAPELRRKCDIARRIIEVTMGDVLMETRRDSLMKTVELLEERISDKTVK